MARHLLLVRHGKLDECYDKRYIGRMDVPLRESWIAQSEPLAGFVRSQSPAKCYCSPQLRARQTFDVVAAGTSLEMNVDDDLREMDFGRWEGKTWDEVTAEDPVATKAWWEMREDFAFPGGESLTAFWARISRAAHRLASDPAEVVLAVSHGGPIRMLICKLLGLEIRDFLLFNPRRGTCAVLDVFDGTKGVLTGLNLPAEGGMPWPA